MIDYKYYKEILEFAKKSGLAHDKETMRIYVKMVELFTNSLSQEIERLKMKNLSGRLQHGEIGVNRKAVKEHIATCNKVISGIDEAFKIPANFARGARIAKLTNDLSNSLFTFKLEAEMASSLEGQAEFEDELIKEFNKKQSELTLKAAFDGTKRRNLVFSLDLQNGRGGTVNYNKKESRFTFIQYALKGYAKRIDI